VRTRIISIVACPRKYKFILPSRIRVLARRKIGRSAAETGVTEEFLLDVMTGRPKYGGSERGKSDQVTSIAARRCLYFPALDLQS